MANIIENIHRNTEAWLDVKSAVTEKGVDCPVTTPAEDVAGKIREIETGITPSGNILITANGYYQDVSQYQYADVAVPDNIDLLARILYGNTFINAYPSSRAIQCVIPSSYNQIGDSMLAGRNLSSIVVPYSIVQLGEYAFAYNPFLTELKFNTTILSSISRGLCEGCPRLNTIDIPEGVSVIGDDAFKVGSDDYRLLSDTEIYLPSSLEYLSETAFHQRLGYIVTDVYYKGTQEKWDEMANDPDTYGGGFALLLEYSEKVHMHYNYTGDDSESPESEE